MIRHLPRCGQLSLVLVSVMLAACVVDGVTSLEFSGNRYSGAIIPLAIEPTDLTKIGAPDRSNGLATSQLQVFSLRNVDSANVLIVPGAPGDESPYIVFVRDAVYPTSSPGPNLFQLVPQLCAYATPATDGCP